ncbi:MAG: tetratricopeptide repeat protein, partial [Thermodesulfovibrionales bacterium]|nr:tetratricopeptide repeat protein [Thermodesulfovibrionales bacterium]
MKAARACSVFLALLFIAAPALSAADMASGKTRELTSKASEHMSRMEYDKALPLLEKAIEMNPEDSAALRYLAIYNQQIIEPLCKSAAEAYFSGNYISAVDNWEKLISRSASESRRVQPLISSAIKKARKQELEKKYQAVNSLMVLGRFVQAAEELEVIIRSFPKEQKARAMLAELSGSLSTNVIKEHYSRAKELMDAGDYRSAISELEAVLELDPKQELAKKLIINAMRSKYKDVYSQAEELLASGKYMMARETYIKVLENNPTDTIIASALSRLDEAIRITPGIQGSSNLEKVLSVSIYNYVSPDGDPKTSVAAAWYATQIAPFNSLAQTIREFIELNNAHASRLLDAPVKDMDIVEQYLFAALNHIYEGRYDLTVEAC